MTIYKTRERPVPVPVTESRIYKNLNEIQRQNFFSRLNYIEEICLRSQDWFQSREGFESSSDFIDYIELDLYVNLSCGDADRSVSPWLVHSSWVFESSPQAMLSSLPECVTDDSANEQIGFNCGEKEFLDWLAGQVRCMGLVLDQFYESKTFDDAIGRLIGIDICLSVLLLGISKQRFNSKLMD